MVRHGIELPTDVIVVGTLREEFGFAFDDQTQLGTIGAFATRGEQLFGVTCAHCITGPDSDFNTPDRIRIEFPSRGCFLWVGQSSEALKVAGRGQPGDFGDFDAGLIEISEPSVSAYLQTRPQLSSFRPSGTLDSNQLLDLLRFTPVQGWGANTNNIIRGQIDGVLCSVQSHHFDLMISDASGEGLTSPGDSGLMWIGPYGQAYGMHMIGDGDAGSASMHCFACFAHRIADRWQLGLLAT